jgi:hypothetical protein
MDFSKLNSWLQVSANIGIVLGLVLVGVQLKQNTDLARIQMLNEETQRVVDYELEVVGERGAEVWAKSIEDPENLTLDEVRILEALLWSFTENLRGTYRLAQLGLLEEEDWRVRLESEVVFYLSDRYSRAWWANYAGSPSPSVPEELRLAIDAVIASDDRDVTDYILAPQRALKTPASTE